MQEVQPPTMAAVAKVLRVFGVGKTGVAAASHCVEQCAFSLDIIAATTTTRTYDQNELCYFHLSQTAPTPHPTSLQTRTPQHTHVFWTTLAKLKEQLLNNTTIH